MEQVTDLLQEFPSLRPPSARKGERPRTAVYLTAKGRKELEEVPATHVGRLAQAAWKGLQEIRLRNEGRDDRGIIWAFGSGNTTRICGYFVNESDRKVFVVCGVWSGKEGGGDKRPAYGDTVVATTQRVRGQGVTGIAKEEVPQRTAQDSPESKGEALLRAWAARRSR